MHAAFTGLLLVPLTSPLRRTVTVTFSDGTPVAVIRRKFVSNRNRFEILDAAGSAPLATGAATSFDNDHYRLLGPRSEVILEYLIDFRGRRRGIVRLADGRELTTTGTWSARDFTFADAAGGLVGSLVTTSSAWSMRSADLVLDLGAPVLTLLQAIGMTQCLLTLTGSRRRDAG